MKPSQILRETTIPQIRSRLIRFGGVDGDEIMGKCAMGVLACESGNPDLKLAKMHQCIEYEAIFEAFGIAKEDQYMPHINVNLINCDPEYSDDDRYSDLWDFDKTYPIHFIVTSLNDNLHFTFDEIAEFLEVTFDL